MLRRSTNDLRPPATCAHAIDVLSTRYGLNVNVLSICCRNAIDMLALYFQYANPIALPGYPRAFNANIVLRIPLHLLLLRDKLQCCYQHAINILSMCPRFAIVVQRWC